MELQIRFMNNSWHIFTREKTNKFLFIIKYHSLSRKLNIKRLQIYIYT